MALSETLQQTIARNVREYRQARGMTLDTLAAAADISRRMLILIERGATNPSIGTLDRIGQALGVGFAALAGLPPSTGEAQVIAPGAMPIVWQGEHPPSAARLTVALSGQGDVELWDWRLAPGDRFAATPDLPGTQKLFFVLEGALTIGLGSTTLLVPTGHGARLSADRPHSYENHADLPLHFVATIVLPTSGH
jgi:transcriptional regulator with XRE-family HTH domain